MREVRIFANFVRKYFLLGQFIANFVLCCYTLLLYKEDKYEKTYNT